MGSLDIFHPHTDWFARSLGAPTAVQEAEACYRGGRPSLISAPTGTGKTLSAFLVFIDRLMSRRVKATSGKTLLDICVAAQIARGRYSRGLRRPLEDLAGRRRSAGDDCGSLRVAMRTGDTPQSERRRMVKSPPHIRSPLRNLFLMLSAKSGQSILRTARWIIIDDCTR